MKVTRFIRSMARTIALVVLITVSGVSSAAAALLASDFLTAGDGFITRDDVTGLEWLDLNMTTSLSPNEVLGGALGLLTTHGFRYAVRNEIDTLYLSQGLTIDTGFVVGNEPGAGNLISLMGCTFGCGGNSPGHEGFMEPNSLTPVLPTSSSYNRILRREPPGWFSVPHSPILTRALRPLDII